MEKSQIYSRTMKILKLSNKRDVYKKEYHGNELVFNVESDFELRLFEKHEENFLIDKISEYLYDGDIVWDIGSHAGYHALHFAAIVGMRGFVLAIDANPTCYKRLCENLMINNQLAVFPLLSAVTDKPGFIEICYSNSLYERSLRLDMMNGKKITTIKSTSIDNLSRFFREPNFIKIDVEGAEDRVIAGAMGVLSRGEVKGVFLEWHIDMIPGGLQKIAELEETLLRFGYHAVFKNKRRMQVHAIYIKE